MKHRIAGMLLRLWVASLAAGLAVHQVRGATVKVDIANFSFTPQIVTINTGDTVEWIMQDQATEHNVVSTTPAGILGSPLLMVGQTYSFTFQTPGTYDYECSLHTFMTGTVIVQDAAVDQPPSVSLSSPADGTVVAAPFNGLLQATAADPDGTVTNVSFLANGTLLGAATQSPFNLAVTNLAAGTYALTAVAIDNGGISTTSSPVTLFVDAPPTVSITAPTNGAVLPAPFTGTLQVSASDSDGTVTNVGFFAGGALLGNATQAPFNLTVSNLAAGAYTLSAVATDDRGLQTISTPVSITVVSSLMVAITSPTNDTLFVTGTNVTLLAAASEAGEAVAQVAFYQERFNPGPVPPSYSLLGSVTNPPYSLTLTNVLPGFIHIVAQATDLLGATNLSAGVRLIVYTPVRFGSISRAADGTVQVNFTGTSFVIETSPDLQTWTQATNGPTQNADGSWTLEDTSTRTNTVRFYRARHVFHEILPL
ncbi:MAG: cupredoxin domain-containing protein [Verrucomicrobia bacterium]|nr:cupredoxin domain-containing protein [Verrucomicrobiota bacterium]